MLQKVKTSVGMVYYFLTPTTKGTPISWGMMADEPPYNITSLLDESTLIYTIFRLEKTYIPTHCWQKHPRQHWLQEADQSECSIL